MKTMTVSEVTAALKAPPAAEAEIKEICIDSRMLKKDCLFFCIKGENFDGHDFAAKALEAGAAAVVCERDCGLGDRQILVKSTREALKCLAGYYRSKFNIPVVGLTGSVGKTTTKDMTHVVLSSKYKTLKNEGNLNNEIGVPLTLFRLDDSFEAAVIEMGMSGFGEISALTAIVRPTVAIISNIGFSHIEKLGSRENILKAKLEILEGLAQGAPLILNADDDMLITVVSADHPIKYFGLDSEKSAVKASEIECGATSAGFTASYEGGTKRVELPVSGKHNVYNALAAITAGMALGVSPEQAAKALALYTPSGMRQKITKKGGLTVIEDCYNASPASQEAALEVLKGLEAQRRIAVLGDMKELGFMSEQAHRGVGIAAAERGVDVLLTYGEQSKFTCEAGRENGIPLCLSFDDKDALADYLTANTRPGDALLFKASRAMRLEDVIKKLYESMGKD